MLYCCNLREILQNIGLCNNLGESGEYEENDRYYKVKGSEQGPCFSTTTSRIGDNVETCNSL